MSNQDPQHPNPSIEDAAVEKRRRFIKGASAAVPVILTLSSPSAFGAVGLCLSQQMSGNASGQPGSCVKGNAPAYWKNPLYKANWPAGFYYGTGTSTTNCNLYSDGTGLTAATKFNAANAFGTSAGAITPIPTTSMRSLLCFNSLSATSTWIAALLNAAYFNGGVNGQYVLTQTQVLAMWHGTLAPPPDYANTPAGKVAFLNTTW